MGSAPPSISLTTGPLRRQSKELLCRLSFSRDRKRVKNKSPAWEGRPCETRGPLPARVVRRSCDVRRGVQRELPEAGGSAGSAPEIKSAATEGHGRATKKKGENHRNTTEHWVPVDVTKFDVGCCVLRVH